jgi:dipeptidyl aminopeptidase/acylaminoacyl peptidase
LPFLKSLSLCLVLTAGLLGTVGPADAATTGANGQVAFNVRTTSGGLVRSEIWSRSSGGARTLMTGSDGLNDYAPTWSPEGGPHLAYVGAKALPAGRHGPGDIYWTTPQASYVQHVTSGAAYDDESPAWAPEGGRMVFSRAAWSNGHAAPADIWTITYRGYRPKDRTKTQGADDIEPAWSPNGLRIAFSSDRAGGYGVYVLRLRGSVLSRAASRGRMPNWSPDGNRIVFVRGGDIWAMDADGSNQRRLTAHPSGRPDSHPNFSPDRRRIIFQRGDRVYTMGLLGANLRRVPTGDSPAGDPDFRPACNFTGTDGHDVIRGTDGPDLICFSDGGDTVYGRGGNDVIFGGSGGDTIYGGGGDDLIQSGGDRSVAGDHDYGGPGDDFIDASPLHDWVYGGGGSDRLYGAKGNDYIDARDGVQGNDIADGGLGSADNCLIDPSDEADNCP